MRAELPVLRAHTSNARAIDAASLRLQAPAKALRAALVFASIGASEADGALAATAGRRRVNIQPSPAASVSSHSPTAANATVRHRVASPPSASFIRTGAGAGAALGRFVEFGVVGAAAAGFPAPAPTFTLSAGKSALAARSCWVSHQLRLNAGIVSGPVRFGTIANLRVRSPDCHVPSSRLTVVSLSG